MTAPVVVLENKGYDISIGTQFLQKFDGSVNIKNSFSLLDYCFPFAPDSGFIIKGLWNNLIASLDILYIFLLYYNVTQAKVYLPNVTLIAKEGISIYPLGWAFIPSKSQFLLNTGICFNITKGHFATITSIFNPSPCETLVFPGIFNPAYSE